MSLTLNGVSRRLRSLTCREYRNAKFPKFSAGILERGDFLRIAPNGLGQIAAAPPDEPGAPRPVVLKCNRLDSLALKTREVLKSIY